MYSKIYDKSYLHEIYKNQMIFCEKKEYTCKCDIYQSGKTCNGEVLQNTSYKVGLPSWKSCFSVSHKPEILLLWREQFHLVSSSPETQKSDFTASLLEGGFVAVKGSLYKTFLVASEYEADIKQCIVNRVQCSNQYISIVRCFQIGAHLKISNSMIFIFSDLHLQQ